MDAVEYVKQARRICKFNNSSYGCIGCALYGRCVFKLDEELTDEMIKESVKFIEQWAKTIRRRHGAHESINEPEEKKMDMETKQIFATRIKTLRKERRLTQEEIAAELNISNTCVCLYESASRGVDITVLARYASFFSVTSDYLLGLSNNRAIPKEMKDGWEIKITSDGDKTTAKLYENGNAVREDTVTRYYKDTYSTEVAAKEAVSKLFAPRGFTGKAMFVGDPEGYNDGFTYGKIYEFINGYCIDNDGDRRPSVGAPTTLESGDWGMDIFIKVVE